MRRALIAAAAAFAAAAGLVAPAAATAQAMDAPASRATRPLAEQEAALELFRARLMQSVRRHGGYPGQALEQKLEGDVAFEVGVGADGTLRRVDLARSSGHALLDRDAAELPGRAVPLTEIPQALQNRPFVILVQLAFRLPN